MALIQAHLVESGCMRLPDRCGEMSDEVVLLQRAVRGLWLADSQWSLRLRRMLIQKMGMKQSKADPCVFLKMVDGEVSLVVCAHADDIFVATKGKETFV